MKHKIQIGAVIVSLAAFIGLLFFTSPFGRSQQQPIAHTIIQDDVGYTPSSLTIKRSDSITWINRSSKDMWPASDLHPTHSLYPNTGIWNCGAKDPSMLFDSCVPIAPGDDFTFVFEHKGTWKFHDHLHSSKRGIIVVE